MTRRDVNAHLTDEELAEMFGGEAGPDLLASVDDHINACPSCREIVVGLARTAPPAPPAPSGPTTPRPDESFGRYVLRDVIGVGGMGIVYAAHDPHLRRKIAIKVLRPGPGPTDPQARSRLLKEARAIARLSHPNVVTVYDVGLQINHIFLAMEHIDGQTLRDWLKEAPRSRAEIVAVCLQAARGLAAAHRAGVVHRDFKPANVLVGKDGRVCVTDFGLAQMSEATISQVSTELGGPVPPLDAGQTVSGALVGTPAYMAPEQFLGETAGAPSDQFSFAATLFEALHRRRPFSGRTVAEIRENVTGGRLVEGKDDGVPRRVRRVLRRALATKPAERFASMDALIAALEPPRRRAAWIAAGLVVAAAGGAAIVTLRPAHTPAAFEASIQSTRRITFDTGCEEYPSFFPDGKSIVYDALVEGDIELTALDLETSERRRLTHAPGRDFGATVAPDARHIAYQHSDESVREIRVIGAEGDSAAPPVSLPGLRGMAAWTRDGRVVAGGKLGEVLVVDPASGDTPRPLGSVPDGARALREAALRGGGVAAVARETHLSRDLVQLVAAPTVDGYYFTRPGPSGAILAWRPAGDGPSAAVPGGVSPSYGFSFSPDGKRLVWSTCHDTSFIARVGIGGPEQPLGQGDWKDFYPRRLGAGRLILSSERAGRLQMWAYDLGRGQVQPLGAPGTHAGSASPDGRRLVYLDGDRGPGIWTVAVAGGAPSRLTTSASDDLPQLAFDGNQVLFERVEPGRGGRAFVVAPGSAPRALTEGPSEMAAASPVDDTVVFVDTSAKPAVVMRTRLAGGATVPVAGLEAADWRDPRISPDGTRLVAVRKRRELVEVALDGKSPAVVRWVARPEEYVGKPEYAPDGEGFIAEIFRYDGDLWLAEGRFP